MCSYLLHYYALYSHEYGDMGSTHTSDYNQDQNTAWNKPQNSSFHNTQAGMLKIKGLKYLTININEQITQIDLKKKFSVSSLTH